jgi:hypothetical protein
LTFEKRGNGILVSGDTFPIKAHLKELGDSHPFIGGGG